MDLEIAGAEAEVLTAIRRRRSIRRFRPEPVPSEMLTIPLGYRGEDPPPSPRLPLDKLVLFAE